MTIEEAFAIAGCSVPVDSGGTARLWVWRHCSDPIWCSQGIVWGNQHKFTGDGWSLIPKDSELATIVELGVNDLPADNVTHILPRKIALAVLGRKKAAHIAEPENLFGGMSPRDYCYMMFYGKDFASLSRDAGKELYISQRWHFETTERPGYCAIRMSRLCGPLNDCGFADYEEDFNMSDRVSLFFCGEGKDEHEAWLSLIGKLASYKHLLDYDPSRVVTVKHPTLFDGMETGHSGQHGSPSPLPPTISPENPTKEEENVK